MRRHASGWRILRLILAGPLLAMIALTATVGLQAPEKSEALDSEEMAFLGTINDYRAQNGLGPLALNDSLNGVARWMANDLAANNYFSHTDSLGRDPFQRMDQLGYNYNTWRGENLVAGTDTAPYAFQLWKDSPGHNANMLGTHYTVIGIARAYNASSDFEWYWATEFGGEGAAPPPPPPPPPPPAPTQAPAYQPPPAPVAVYIAPPAAPDPEPPADVAPPPPAATPAPTPWPGPRYQQTAWWRSLDALTLGWDIAAFARQLMALSPAIEETFVRMVRGA